MDVELIPFFSGGSHLSYVDQSGVRRVEAFETPDDVKCKLHELKDMPIRRLTLKGNSSAVEWFASFDAVKAFPLVKEIEDDEPYFEAVGYIRNLK
jgi:hypothetical protein